MEIAGLIISIFSVIIAVGSILISVKQNRKLHNENRILSSEPSLSVDLLFDSKIGGHTVIKKDAIDSFNVWESKYTPLYVENEILLEDSKRALFTIVIKNNGNAVANDICIKELKLISKSWTKTFSDRKILFESCSQSEEKANRIYIKQDSESIEKVELTIEYFNLLNQINCRKYYYQIDGEKAMLRYIKCVKQ